MQVPRPVSEQPRSLPHHGRRQAPLPDEAVHQGAHEEGATGQREDAPGDHVWAAESREQVGDDREDDLPERPQGADVAQANGLDLRMGKTRG